MGLNERRAQKNFETERFPQLTREIARAAGFDVPIEVNWEGLALPDQSALYADSWTKVYFTPLIDALKAITVDDMGKQALKAGLKKVIITNTGGIYSADRMSTFVGGVLTLNHEPTTNVDDVGDRQRGIQSTLESAL
jgi:hypothetical protein